MFGRRLGIRVGDAVEFDGDAVSGGDGLAGEDRADLTVSELTLQVADLGARGGVGDDGVDDRELVLKGEVAVAGNVIVIWLSAVPDIPPVRGGREA